MKHLLSLTQLYWAVLVVAIGLSTYGCADSATVNPVVELASLTVTPGTLQPTFNGSTTQYSVDLTSNITTVTVTAQPAVAGDSVTINGQATTSSVIILGPAGTTTPVSIVVSESGNNSRTYTVLINRAGLAGNNSLSDLIVSPGPLAPTFNANQLSYTVSVANNVGSVDVTPILSDPAATMTVNGDATTSGQASTITLNGPGLPTTITILVKAQNGTEKPYTVTVSRGISNNNLLQNLTISPGTLAFSPGTTGYTVNLPSTLPGNPTSMTVTPTLQDQTASMSMSVNNGQPTNINSGEPQTAPLPAPGSSTFINIVVTAENGIPKPYTVNVIRAALSGNNNLQSLTTSPVALSPLFSTTRTRTDYTVNASGSVDSITVTAAPQDPGATLRILVNNVVTTTSPIPLPAGPSTTEIEIIVRAPNGVEKSYFITVNRAAPSGNNNLSDLTVKLNASSPNLITNFSSTTVTYTVVVATDVTEVTVTAIKSDQAATISGDLPNSGQAVITLTGAGTTTPVSIIVRAPDGTPNEYRIDVIRAAPAAPPAASAEGRWTGTIDTGRTVAWFVLDDGVYWALYSAVGNPSILAGLVQGDSSSQNGVFSSSNAKDFNLETGMLNATINGSYVMKQSLNGTITYQAGGQSTSFTTTYDSKYDLVPDMNAVAGTYTGPVTASETATVVVTSTGGISGNTTTGCLFTGTFSPRAHGNVFNVTITFGGQPGCSIGTDTVNGIGFYDAGINTLTSAALNSTGTDGFVFIGQKP